MKDLLIDYLAQHVELNEEEKAFLLSLDIFRSVKKGKTLLHAGDYSNLGYFVLKGCIRGYYLVDGEEKTTAFYTEMPIAKKQTEFDKFKIFTIKSLLF